MDSIKPNYDDLGMDQYGNALNSPLNSGIFNTALDFNIQQEPTPYLHRTTVSKGTVQTNLGGLVDFRDTTGGTQIITYNPTTGSVTINGGIILGQTLIGTLNNSLIQGTTTLTGSLASTGLITGGTFGSLIMTSGTLNNEVIGTPAITGGTANQFLLGSVTIVGGTIQSLGAGTLNSPNITGTPQLAINAGSPILGVNGNFALETYGGSMVLAARSGGTTWYWLPAGTLT